jgi:hypothetical protein
MRGIDHSGYAFMDAERMSNKYSGFLWPGIQRDETIATDGERQAVDRPANIGSGSLVLSEQALNEVDELLQNEAYSHEQEGTMAVGVVNAIAKFIPTAISMFFWVDEEHMNSTLAFINDKFTMVQPEKEFQSRKAREEARGAELMWSLIFNAVGIMIDPVASVEEVEEIATTTRTLPDLKPPATPPGVKPAWRTPSLKSTQVPDDPLTGIKIGDTTLYGPFYRTGNVRQLMEESGEWWGRGVGNTGSGYGRPEALAYTSKAGPIYGSTPTTQFFTTTKPLSHGPTTVGWPTHTSLGPGFLDPFPGVRGFTLNGDDWAAVKVVLPTLRTLPE